MPMATYSSFTQNSTSREDSRISRSTGSTNKCSPTSAATESSWQSQQNRHYSQPLQTSYQHLQGSMYSDVSNRKTQRITVKCVYIFILSVIDKLFSP